MSHCLKPPAFSIKDVLEHAPKLTDGPKSKCPPAKPPARVTAESILNDVTNVAAIYREEFVDSVTLFVSDEGACIVAEAFAQSQDDAYARAVEQLGGRYSRIGDFWGAPIFRQEKDEHHTMNLTLIYIVGAELGEPRLSHLQGWFIIDGPVFDSLLHAATEPSSTAIVAWCGHGKELGETRGDVTVALPTSVHVPYWSKKPHVGILLTPTLHYLEQMLQIQSLDCARTVDKDKHIVQSDVKSHEPDKKAQGAAYVFIHIYLSLIPYIL